jgi:hypothetical protein
MSRKIFKYGFAHGSSELEIIAPQPQRVVHFADQLGEYCVWVEVLAGNSKQRATFRFFATGEPVPREGEYIDTCMSAGGRLVWHLYQMTEWEWAE